MNLLVILLVFGFASIARAEDDLPPVVRAGFDAYTAKGAEGAWRAWGLEEAQPGVGQKGQLGTEAKAKFLATAADMAKNYGKPLGYELIRRFDVSPSYQTVYVLWKFERRPLSCMFVCYHAQDEWKILNFFAGSDPREFLPESVSGMPRNPQ